MLADTLDLRTAPRGAPTPTLDMAVVEALAARAARGFVEAFGGLVQQLAVENDAERRRLEDVRRDLETARRDLQGTRQPPLLSASSAAADAVSRDGLLPPQQQQGRQGGQGGQEDVTSSVSSFPRLISPASVQIGPGGSVLSPRSPVSGQTSSAVARHKSLRVSEYLEQSSNISPSPATAATFSILLGADDADHHQQRPNQRRLSVLPCRAPDTIISGDDMVGRTVIVPQNWIVLGTEDPEFHTCLEQATQKAWGCRYLCARNRSGGFDAYRTCLNLHGAKSFFAGATGGRAQSNVDFITSSTDKSGREALLFEKHARVIIISASS